MATTKLAPCTCRAFEFGEFDGENENAISYDTNCAESTQRTFAQGHDAKLVGFLVRAELAGEEIRMVSGGVAISFPGAVNAAQKISDALAAKTRAQLDAARARVAKKAANAAAKKATRSAKKAETPAAQPTKREAKIKVGRWTYNATIDTATGRAVWTSKLGKINETEQGSYTEV